MLYLEIVFAYGIYYGLKFIAFAFGYIIIPGKEYIYIDIYIYIYIYIFAHLSKSVAHVVYFWIPYFVPLVYLPILKPISCCLDYCIVGSLGFHQN